MAARSGREALLLASETVPSVIVSDIGMPEMDGYELLVALRFLPGLKSVPAIAISGYAREEDLKRASSAGFLAHLAKPINADELFALIQRITS